MKPEALPRRRNSGFSLFEIILALAIFGIAIAALGNIVTLGAKAAIESRDLAYAQIMCQSKMAEIMLNPAGPQPIAQVSLQSNDTLRQWEYSVVTMPAPVPGMVAVTVTVQTANVDASVTPVQYTLTRWIVDPALDLQGLEDEAAAESDELTADAAAAEEGS
ncbi:MAG: prepilin-type N-terminal cleavage/methylation domain-containing protein [Pirellulaceae bacterium]